MEMRPQLHAHPTQIMEVQIMEVHGGADHGGAWLKPAIKHAHSGMLCCSHVWARGTGGYETE
eukprot:scaffold13625_cov20-Tisochrysis_lutea.AAC.8